MSNGYGACFVSGAGIFENLSSEIKEKIARNSLVHELSREDLGTYEFSISDKVYLVHTGKVFLLYMDENGKKIILNIFPEGSVFGDLNFNNGRENFTESFFIEPFPEAGVCEMNKDNFEEILRDSPDFALSLISNLSQQLVDIGRKLGTVAFSNVEARLIAQIVYLGQEHGEENDDTLTVNLRLTHEKLGELIGAARETVSETISNLRRREIIRIDENKHITLNKAKLDLLF